MTDQSQLPELSQSERRGEDVKVRTSEDNFFYGGAEFSDWVSLEVNRSMTTAAGSFKMVVAHSRPWPLRPGTGVRVSVAEHGVLTGAVNKLRSRTRGDDRSLRFVGRDATADLVDCSVRGGPGEWLGLTARQIISQICKPFSIPVSAQGALGNSEADIIPLHRSQPGERAWAAIERILRMRGLLAYADGDGGLLISRIGLNYSDGELIEGEGGNVVETDIEWGDSERYSEYTVLGQGAGSDDGWADAVVGPAAQATDGSISRYRPLVLIAEGPVNESEAKLRAEWEAAYRAAKSASMKVTVNGWRQIEGVDRGRVWAVNELVHCRIPSQGLDQQMLIDSLSFRRDGGSGSQTILNLVRPDAYQPKPEVSEDAEAFADFLGEED